jgi:hypothetical protein
MAGTISTTACPRPRQTVNSPLRRFSIGWRTTSSIGNSRRTPVISSGAMVFTKPGVKLSRRTHGRFGEARSMKPADLSTPMSSDVDAAFAAADKVRIKPYATAASAPVI